MKPQRLSVRRYLLKLAIVVGLLGLAVLIILAVAFVEQMTGVTP